MTAKRNTIQRQMVMDAVRRHGCHPTAEDVYDMITKDYPDISKGTVYRNLNALLESGFLARVSVPGGADHFDHILSRHYHMLCTECGDLHNFQELPYDHTLDAKVEEMTGFKLQPHKIVFVGICPKCLDKAKKR